MEKVQTVENGVVMVVTDRDLSRATWQFWGWMVSVGLGLFLALTIWAVRLDSQVESVPQLGLETRRLQKSVDSLTVVVGYLAEAVNRLPR